MDNKKNARSMELLDEAAQLKIYGDASSLDTDFTINIGSGCKKNRWAEACRLLYLQSPQDQI